jgi:hypothetical protein
MSPTDFEAALHNVERVERMQAEQFDAAAESARDDLASLPELWPQGHPETEERAIRGRVADAEARAATSRRRADYAAAGYLLVTDAERSDPDYMQRHQHIIGHAYRAGRVKNSDNTKEAMFA